jgi:hypothetical protein
MPDYTNEGNYISAIKDNTIASLPKPLAVEVEAKKCYPSTECEEEALRSIYQGDAIPRRMSVDNIARGFGQYDSSSVASRTRAGQRSVYNIFATGQLDEKMGPDPHARYSIR